LGAWRARAIASFEVLREGGRSGAGRHRGRLGRALVAAQVTLTVVLLCACGMFLRQSWNGAHARWGFDDRGVLTAELSPVRADYPDAAAVNVLSRRLAQRLRQIPGAQDATVATGLPIGDFFGTFFVGVHASGAEAVGARFHGVDADYFRLFGIHLQRGRLFHAGDVEGSEPVAIVNRSLAERLYGGKVIGQRIALDDAGAAGDPWQARIVGVVADAGRQDDTRRDSALYLPLAQLPDGLLARFRDVHPMHLALRVRGSPERYRKALVDAVAAVAPQQPVDKLRSMHSIASDMASGGALTGTWICGTFAVLALLLACAGLYAVMAVAVAARGHEMGVRSALGAPPARLAVLVLHGGLAQVVTGLAVGVLLAAAFPRLFQASFVQLGSPAAFGPWVAGGVCALLLGFGLLACLLPAMRAGRISPMRALREE
jgi:predicted permease